MIETHRLKNVVIFFQTILSFVLSRKTINILFCTDRHWGTQCNNRNDFKNSCINCIEDENSKLVKLYLAREVLIDYSQPANYFYYKQIFFINARQIPK